VPRNVLVLLLQCWKPIAEYFNSFLLNSATNIMLGIRSNVGRLAIAARVKQRSLLSPTANFCMAASAPNNKTLVILDGLPLSTTNSSLQESLSGVENVRKCEVQPGCALHVVDEAGAIFAAKQIGDKLNYSASVRNVCLPSIVLNNVPGSVTAEVIQQSFQKYDPKVIRFSGKRSILVTVADSVQAVDALQLVNSISIDGQTLTGHITTTPDGRFCIQISDLPVGADLSVMLNTISSTVNAELPAATLSASTGTASVKVRVDTKKLSPALLEEALSRVSFGNVTPLSSEVKAVPRPALVLRNVAEVSEDALRTLCVEELKADRVQRTWRSKDMYGDLAFAYFSSEADAYAAIQKLRQANLGPQKVKASYREMSEPAVKVSGLAADMTSFKLQQLFSQFRIHRADILPVTDSGDDGESSLEAIVVVSDYKEATRLREAVNLRKFGDVQYSAEECNISDTSVDFVFSENEVPSADELENALRNAGLSYRSMLSSSNAQAFIAFDTIEQATKSLGGLTQGDIQVATAKTAYEGGGGGGLVSKLSVYPSYIVEVNGISSNDSAENVLDIATEGGKVNVFKSERSATAKFKRHANVIPGMKQLRTVAVGDVKLRPRRFHEVEEEGDSEYDMEPENIKVFDRNHLELMLKDYLTAEPAVRYQIAKNYFERALFTAQGKEDVNYILAEGAPNDVRAECRLLITEKNDIDKLMKQFANDETHARVPRDLKKRLDKNVNRLFQLFIQREDMHQFSRDFDDIEASLGPANPDDAYEWNNFMCNDEESLNALAEDLRFYNGSSKSDRKDAAREKKLADAKQKRRDRREGVIQSGASAEATDTDAEDTEVKSDGTEEAHKLNEKDLDFFEDMQEKKEYDKFDADRLMDYDGHVWSGVIVHQDTTQKVVPGERIISYRCLVSIGNRKGAGGFGMGKGADADIALRNAFRDALKNLIYIDLYENAALAHDLKGKHNDCIIYVRATPKARDMVASPLATSIFNSFGIVSCSAKIVGNRHPYSMVRAIFNALSKHKNIDEIAKERGTRYLTLKWMYDNGL
jgi:small subunit ribosomal protein S5